MEFPYVIMTDLSCDMDLAEAEAADIRLIPMSYMLGDEERVCSQFESYETLHRFYEAQRNGMLTKTTQIPPQVYKEVFTELVKAGRQVLYLALSSGLSNTFASASMAAGWVMEKYPEGKIVCVDSRAATVGLGLLMQAAIRNRASGMTPDENATWLEANRLRVQHWFMVDDLMYLKRGGRVSATTAIVGTALNIKPILTINAEGKLDTIAKKRGERTAMAYLIDRFRETRDVKPEEQIFIAHCDAPDRAAQMAEMARAVNPDAKITIRQITPIIGAHVGPGMCAIVSWGSGREKKA